ncbi:TldD/PmbA family protein [Candidatus Woesearchaeota archaeon]|nr:MAG: TldD/PmbA family protein [Candidatus Woesearchaeota archaeon]
MALVSSRLKRVLDEASDYSIVKSAASSVSSVVRNNRTKEVSSGSSCSYFVRLWKGKKFVSAEMASLDEKNLRRSVRLLRSAPELEFFYGLPPGQKARAMKCFDAELAEQGKDVVLEDASGMIELVRESRFGKGLDVRVTFGHSGVSVNEFEIETSEGLHNIFRSTYYGSSVSITAGSNGKKSSSWESIESGSLVGTRKKENVWRNALMRSLEGLNRKRVKRLPKVVVLSPNVASELLEYAFLPNFRLDMIRDRAGRYALGNFSSGERIFDSNLRIVDNPLKKSGINSYPFDYDGSRSKKVDLVKDGSLKGVVSDYNTSKRFGVENNGHAGRSSIEFSNIEVSGKNVEVDDFILVESVIGSHTSNSATTEFSVLSDSAVLIRKGERVPLEPFMMFGRMEDILKSAGFYGKRETRSGITMKGLVTDRIRLSH